MRYIANWSVGNIGGNRGETYGKILWRVCAKRNV